MSLNIVEEFDTGNEPFSGQIICKRFECGLNNLLGVFDDNGYLIANRKFVMEFGTRIGDIIEWVPMGVFYSDDWIFSEDETVLTVNGHDILALYDDVNYVDTVVYTEVDGELGRYLEASATAIMTNILSNVSGVNYVINSLFDDIDITVPTYFDELDALKLSYVNGSKTCRQMLFQIVQVAYDNSSTSGYLNWCYTDKFGNIVIKQIDNAYTEESNAIENYYKLKKENTYYKNLNKFTLLAFNGAFVATTPSTPNESQKIYGVKEIIIQDNSYIPDIYYLQNRVINLLESFYANVNSANDDVISLEWWGNPSLEIYDNVLITNVKTAQIYSCKLISNNYNYNGFLKCTSRFKVLETA
jgi:hypothetical protein